MGNTQKLAPITISDDVIDAINEELAYQSTLPGSGRATHCLMELQDSWSHFLCIPRRHLQRGPKTQAMRLHLTVCERWRR